jgi:ribosomal-protein-alanine N-acetyltransferase
VTPRLAELGDAAALAEVHAAAFATPWSFEDIRPMLSARGAFALGVDAAAGGLAGFILCRVIAGEAEVLTLAVRPEHRRHGLGRALLAAAEAIASNTATAMFLEVAADNAAAIALYAAAGYEAVGRRASYYARPAGAGADAIVMRRALNS